MLLAPDEDEVRIADEARRILSDIAPIARLHGSGLPELSVSARRSLGESGWFGLSLPEQAGGAGMSAVEFALFFREAGRQCLSVDVLAQTLATLLVANRPELRDPLIGGERAVALLVAGSDETRLLGAESDWALEVHPESARLLDVGGLSVEMRSALDPAVSMRRLSNATPPVLFSANGEELWRQGQLAVAAMLLGIAEAAFELLVDYVKVRQTFGRPIGSYQAVRHPCADIAMRVEAARCQLWFSAAALKMGLPDATAHLDAAKHLANEAAAFATDLNIQLHGGIGVTDEHDAHILMKHALLLRKLFGSKRTLLNHLLHAQLGN